MSLLGLGLPGLLADVPNPPPVDPTGGAVGVGQLLAYAKWGALIVCAAVAVVSGGAIAWGGASDRPDAKQRGKYGLVGAVVGAVAVAVAIPAVNVVFSSAS